MTIFDHYSVLGEVQLNQEDAIKILAQSQNVLIGDNNVRLIPRGSMKSLILTGLPEVVSEKDLYLVLNKVNSQLRRVVIADDSEVSFGFLGFKFYREKEIIFLWEIGTFGFGPDLIPSCQESRSELQ